MYDWTIYLHIPIYKGKNVSHTTFEPIYTKMSMKLQICSWVDFLKIWFNIFQYSVLLKSII